MCALDYSMADLFRLLMDTSLLANDLFVLFDAFEAGTCDKRGEERYINNMYDWLICFLLYNKLLIRKILSHVLCHPDCCQRRSSPRFRPISHDATASASLTANGHDDAVASLTLFVGLVMLVILAYFFLFAYDATLDTVRRAS